MPDTFRNHFVAMIGEFAGTFLFLFFAFTGTQVANMWAMNQPADFPTGTGPQPAALLYISLSFGFSLAVNAWTFFRISGGLFNPAVSSQ
jgi:aquaporin rerated protein, other eukaryote